MVCMLYMHLQIIDVCNVTYSWVCVPSKSTCRPTNRGLKFHCSLPLWNAGGTWKQIVLLWEDPYQNIYCTSFTVAQIWEHEQSRPVQYKHTGPVQ